MSGFDELNEIAEAIKSTKKPHTLTPRKLISYYDWQRRGRVVNARIRSDLASLGLTTQPDFESSYIDGEIAVLLVEANSAAQSGSDDKAQSQNLPDPSVRVRMLAAANKAPVSVKRDDALEIATTKMLLHDFSQLPVMSNEWTVDGLISWRSIGQNKTFGRQTQCVRDCMDRSVQVIPNEMPLLTAIPLVYAHEIVLVKGPNSKIVGLITMADLGLEFVQLSEPFLLIGEIEARLRRLIDRVFTLAELNELRAAETEPEIKSAADLMFGQYIRLFQKPAKWSKLRINLDRAIICTRLDKIREIRNDVMHFDPDGVEPTDLIVLREMVKLLEIVNEKAFAD